MQQAGNFSFIQDYTSANQLVGYTYDASGNLLSDQLGNVLQYDANGMVVSDDGTNYIYGPDGNRVEKAGSTTTDTIYFGGRPVAYYSAGAWTDMVYGPNGLLAEVPGTEAGAPIYRMTDHLGSAAGTVSAAGAVLSTQDYAPFGQAFAGGIQDPYQFTELERDQESGLDHTTFRQYSSPMGRWLSPDPYNGSYDASNPQSLNRYSYVSNMPLSFTDPTGQFGEGAVACAAGPIACAGGLILTAIFDYEIFSNFFDGPSFHGSLKPRPSTGDPNWDGNFGESNGLPVNGPSLGGGGIAGALGLPTAGCEFGACGAGPSSFGPGSWSSGDYPNGNDPSDLNLFGGFYDALKETIFGKKPSAACVQEATAFANKYDVASRKVPYGNISTGIDIARAFRAKSLLDLTSAFYTSYAGDKALSDAGYASALRKCMSEGR